MRTHPVAELFGMTVAAGGAADESGGARVGEGGFWIRRLGLAACAAHQRDKNQARMRQSEHARKDTAKRCRYGRDCRIPVALVDCNERPGQNRALRYSFGPW